MRSYPKTSLYVILLSLLLWLAAPRAAADVEKLQTDQEVTNTTTVRASLAIAVDFWGVDRCSTVRVFVSPLLSADDRAESIDELPCATWLRPQQMVNTAKKRVERCSILVHEYGHWLGLKHSLDPDSIMYKASGIVRRCYMRFTSRRKKRLDIQTYGQLGWSTR